MVKLQFHFQSSAILKQRTKLKSFLSHKLFESEFQEGCVEVILVDDPFLLSMNQQYLQHDDYTDIITFNLSDSPKVLVAELYISYQRVKENAIQRNIPTQIELHRVIFHGVLHLLGHNDKTNVQQAHMRSLEDEWLLQFQSWKHPDSRT